MGMRRRPLVPRVHIGARANIPSAKVLANLKTILPHIARESQGFALSLVDNHEAYGGWTPRQLEYATRLIKAAGIAYFEHLNAMKRNRT